MSAIAGMGVARAAEPGQRLEDIDTPALILEMDAFERNLASMAAATDRAGMRLRPHAKSHKCPEIARAQIALGAVGICCQKVSEAEAFVAAGIGDILVTNEIVGARKLERLARLAQHAQLGVLVDHPANVDALGKLVGDHRIALDVYIEVDVGGGRCGVAPGAAAVALAGRIAHWPGLRLAGLHCYHGAAQHLREPAHRAAAIASAAQAAARTREQLWAAGHTVSIVTGAGTGSFTHERDSGIYNELQPGSYVFLDRDYGENQIGPGEPRFEHALFVETTVMSVPAPDRAVVDAGLKASSIDSGLPAIWQREGLRYLKCSDEHGVLGGERAGALALGERLRLVPGHCDPTVNLYDWLVCVRDRKVEAVWPIAARGALL